MLRAVKVKGVLTWTINKNWLNWEQSGLLTLS